MSGRPRQQGPVFPIPDPICKISPTSSDFFNRANFPENRVQGGPHRTRPICRRKILKALQVCSWPTSSKRVVTSKLQFSWILFRFFIFCSKIFSNLPASFIFFQALNDPRVEETLGLRNRKPISGKVLISLIFIKKYGIILKKDIFIAAKIFFFQKQKQKILRQPQT